MRCVVRVYLGLAAVGALIGFLIITFIYKSTSEEHVDIESKGKLAGLLSQRLEYLKHNKPSISDTGKNSNPRASTTREGSVPQDMLILAEVTNHLHDLMKDLTRLQRKVRSAEVKYQLLGPITQVRRMLHQLSPSTKYEEAAENDTMSSKISITEDVCPEKFTSVDLSGGYPFFYKGFNVLNCTGVPKFSSLVTLVFNTVRQKSNDLARDLIKLISNVHSVYPNIKILLAVEPDIGTKVVKAVKSSNVEILEFESSLVADMDIWNAVIEKVSTRYTFIARDVAHFTWHSRLERLVRELDGLNSFAVAGSYRLMSGLWSHGCEQFHLHNYTLSYRNGYDWSQHECMVCDTVQGPFMVKTENLKQHPFPAKMSHVSGFEFWFISMRRSQNLVVSCPDSMFFVQETQRTNKTSWRDLALTLQIERLKLSSGVEHRFVCSEAGVDCERESGKALSHCCMNELSTAVKLFLQLCKESGSLCELQEGTLLGAVKFGAVLPWERDADITFHSSNFSAISALKPKLDAVGYDLYEASKPWCCVDGVNAGGVFKLQSRGWTLELYGQHLMDSEKLLLQNIPPTLIEFDGRLVPVPASPALYTRNRYGQGVFQHAQHWMTMSSSSGWAFYKAGSFTQCPSPGHHACLDQYLADGNLQFRSFDP